MEFEYDERMGRVKFECPHMGIPGYLPLGPNGWTIVSEEPLTVTPSILNQPCGCHGYITDGKWIKV